MSIQFNDTTNFKGLLQFYELECGFEPGTLSGNTNELKRFAAAVNVALDDFFMVAFFDNINQTWHFDDANQTDYPIITLPLVASQRDYAITTDQQGNLVLDYYRFFVRISSTGVYQEIFAVSPETEQGMESFYDGRNATGVPTRYGKIGNGVFLDPIPSYASTDGLKVYATREASYFTYSDTTKKPGVPGLFHKYFYLKPAMEYQRRNNYKEFVRLQGEVLMLENSIGKYFGRREHDKQKGLKARQEDTQ